MIEAWCRIIAWYEANTPPGMLSFPPGATDKAIRNAEKHVGLSLPDDLRAFYRLHDGSGGKGFLHYGTINSLKQLVSAWEGHRKCESYAARKNLALAPVEIRGSIRPAWWNARRLLITNIGGTDGVMVDFDPAPGGTIGQLIEFSHEFGPWCVLAPSFGTWLQRIAAGLEAGKLNFEDGEVIPPGYYQEGGNLGDWECRLG